MSERSKLYQCVSDEIKDRLAYLGRFMGDASREIGDTTNRIIDDLLSVKGRPNAPAWLADYGIMNVYSFVAEITGQSVRTIRYYSMICSFYTAADWAEFDVLPFSHFAFARGFGDKWREVLETSVMHIEHNGGKPPSVDWLSANFTGISQVEQSMDRISAVNDASQVAHEMTVAAQPVIQGLPDNEKTDYPRQVVSRMVYALARYITGVEISERIRAAIENLAKLIEEETIGAGR